MRIDGKDEFNTDGGGFSGLTGGRGSLPGGGGETSAAAVHRGVQAEDPRRGGRLLGTGSVG